MPIVNNKECYLSNYVILAPTSNGEYVLIHSYLNNINLINQEEADKLLAIKNGHDNVSFDDSTFEQLIQNFYLVEDVIEDKNRFLKIADKLSSMKNKHLSYVIIPSYSCNFSCPYCFEGSITKHNNKLMDNRIVDVIFDNIRKDIEEGNHVSLSLFGGEPLLKENLSINSYIFEQAKIHNLKISVITNGYDLNYYLKAIKDGVFSDFQITLDGSKKYHNETKFTKEDSNTFDKIISNISDILNMDCAAKIKVRINTNKDNINSLKDLYKLFNKKGFLRNNRFSFYTKSVDECGCRKSKEISDPDIVELVPFYNDKIQNMLTNSQYYFMVGEIEEIFHKDKKFGNYKVRYCGAASNNRLIDPFGDIYSCLEEVGKKDQRIGYLNFEDSSIEYTPLKNEWSNRQIQNIDECSNCAYALICGGGCGIAAKKKTGSLLSPNCANNKRICHEVIAEIVNRLEINS